MSKKVRIRLICNKPEKARVKLILNGMEGEYEVQDPQEVNGKTHYPLKKVRSKKKINLDGIY